MQKEISDMKRAFMKIIAAFISLILMIPTAACAQSTNASIPQDALTGTGAEREALSTLSLEEFVEKLLTETSRNTGHLTYSPDDIYVTDAMYSAERWMRVICFNTPDYFIVLNMSSRGEDAVINAIHILGSAEKELTADFLSLGEMIPAFAPEAYTVSESVTESSMPCQCVILDAIHPAELQDVIQEYEGGQEFNPIPDGTITLKEFQENWEMLNNLFFAGDYPLMITPDSESVAPDPSTMKFGQTNDGNLLIFMTKGEDAQISMINISNYPCEPPSASLCGQVALAAASGMDPLQWRVATLSLAEYPFWDDLCNMWPVLAWNDVFLTMCDYEVAGEYHPAAFITGGP